MEIHVRKTKRASRSGKVFAREDIGFLAGLPVLAIVALLVPEKRWRVVCAWLERLRRVPLHDAGANRDLAAFGLDSRADWRRIGAARSEHNIQILRERLVGWRPEIELHGVEHLDAAREEGHGAVLWIGHFAFNALAAKMAFARAGFEVFHVSRPEHGFSKSRFGIRYLNPIRTSAELGYAAGRIVIDRADPAASMNEARRLLRLNKFVSITAGAWEGDLLVDARIGDSVIALAGGAPRLARIAQAPLLPVFVLRDDNSGRILVIVERPVHLERSQDKIEIVKGAAQDFADRHLPYLKAFPHQWRGWEKLAAAETPR